MNPTKNAFQALVVREQPSGTFSAQVETRSISDLPAGEVLIRVHASSLNYKDVLSFSGHKGITREYPHTPGIDAVGVVEESSVPEWKPGDSVIMTGHDFGMNIDGGFAEYARVPAKWLVPLPPNLRPHDAMMLGTAGLTAAQMVDALQSHGLKPDSGKILVTGATGGVGVLAVAILAKIGYSVIAVTGKPDTHELLRGLGATEIIDRAELQKPVKKALLAARWAGVIDTVGGAILDHAIRATAYHGVVTCCGMIGGTELQTTIYPFILRGVTLVGTDTAECEESKRKRLWAQLAENWTPTLPADFVHTIRLAQVPEQLTLMLQSQHRGRTVVQVSG